MSRKWLTFEQIQRDYGYKSKDSIKRIIRTENIESRGEGVKREVCEESWVAYINRRSPNQHFPNFHMKVWDDYLRLKGDWVVTADWHIPFYDNEFADKMLELSHRRGFEKILIAGDFFDELAFSPFNDFDKYSWIDEKTNAREVGEMIFSNFKEVKFLTGNHDIRAFKRQKGAGDPLGVWDEVFKRDDTGKIVSVYAYAVLKSGSNNWHISHPTQGGNTDYHLRRMGELWEGHNIIVTHSHQTKIIQSPSGERVFISIGGLKDPLKIGWKQRRADLTNKWTTSFVTVEDGYCEVFDKDHTNWKRLLG